MLITGCFFWGGGGEGGLGVTLIVLLTYVCIKCLHCSLFKSWTLYSLLHLNVQWVLFSESYLL